VDAGTFSAPHGENADVQLVRRAIVGDGAFQVILDFSHSHPVQKM
jgi:hypothetical protein